MTTTVAQIMLFATDKVPDLTQEVVTKLQEKLPTDLEEFLKVAKPDLVKLLHDANVTDVRACFIMLETATKMLTDFERFPDETKPAVIHHRGGIQTINLPLPSAVELHLATLDGSDWVPPPAFVRTQGYKGIAEHGERESLAMILLADVMPVFGAYPNVKVRRALDEACAKAIPVSVLPAYAENQKAEAARRAGGLENAKKNPKKATWTAEVWAFKNKILGTKDAGQRKKHPLLIIPAPPKEEGNERDLVLALRAAASPGELGASPIFGWTLGTKTREEVRAAQQAEIDAAAAAAAHAEEEAAELIHSLNTAVNSSPSPHTPPPLGFPSRLPMFPSRRALGCLGSHRGPLFTLPPYCDSRCRRRRDGHRRGRRCARGCRRRAG